MARQLRSSMRDAVGIVASVVLGLLSALSVFAEEPHPTLLVKAGELDGLRTKLGTKPISHCFCDDQIGPSLEALLRGQRREESVAYLRDTFNGVSGHSKYFALWHYDLQYQFLTAEERSQYRTGFLEEAQKIYDGIKQQSNWFFARRHLNNWTYAYADFPLQKMLLAGLMFRDDPRSRDFIDTGLTLVTQLFEDFPNNGQWNPQTGEYAPYPTEVDAVDESLFATKRLRNMGYECSPHTHVRHR